MRKRILVTGIVQGVGFRPFVYRLAHQLSLGGYVLNDTRGVEIEVEGKLNQLREFTRKLTSDLPVLARITGIREEYVKPSDETDFVIRPSQVQASRTALVSPDMATCDDCLRELFDPHDRRYRYPFINCTNCGPRYTIIRDVPYDRPNTTMKKFIMMCPSCQREYDGPGDRRFHAQPNACWRCGPQLELVNSNRVPVSSEDPIRATIRALKAGKIAAIKGLGGFHLAVDATNKKAVADLRKRKLRIRKPFAVMAGNINVIPGFCDLSESEKSMLLSPERPVVLLRKKHSGPLAPGIAPANRYLGIMLPYTPIHHLIMRGGHFAALVMTSGNISEEPIARTNEEALEKLTGIADLFLLHNRDIYLRCDDSVVRDRKGQATPVRRARGFAPRPVFISNPKGLALLAVGAELKNTICLTRANNAFLSQHIGNLEGLETYRFFLKTIEQMTRIFQVQPYAIACDKHPDYLSTRYAEAQTKLPVIPVQHHYAHIASVLAEADQTGPVIGVAFDGTGLGEDGCIWGGEFLIADLEGYQRIGHLGYVGQPGADQAAKEPWRMATAHLFALYGGDYSRKAGWFFERINRFNYQAVLEMLHRRANTPLTSSIGRLFDAVAAMLDICQVNTFEAEAAMALEATADPEEDGVYPVEIHPDEQGSLIADPTSIIRGLVADIQQGKEPACIAARFHNTIAHLTLESCKLLRNRYRIEKVALSGGVFQNNILTRLVPELLERAGFEVLEHTQVPCNDGGISLGQAAVALHRLGNRKSK